MKKEISAIPLYDGIFITALKAKTTEGGIITDALNEYQEKQRVVIVGPQCPPEIMKDDIVVLNLEPGISRFVRLKYNLNSAKSDINGIIPIEYKFPIEVFNGVEYMLITSRDIKYIIPVNDEHFTVEERAERSGIVTGIPIV